MTSTVLERDDAREWQFVGVTESDELSRPRPPLVDPREEEEENEQPELGPPVLES